MELCFPINSSFDPNFFSLEVCEQLTVAGTNFGQYGEYESNSKYNFVYFRYGFYQEHFFFFKRTSVWPFQGFDTDSITLLANSCVFDYFGRDSMIDHHSTNCGVDSGV